MLCNNVVCVCQIYDLPQPSYLKKSIGELGIGTYDNIEVAKQETPIIEALHKFVNKRISALPIVDSEGRLVDIYAKFDVIVRFNHILVRYRYSLVLIRKFKFTEFGGREDLQQSGHIAEGGEPAPKRVVRGSLHLQED